MGKSSTAYVIVRGAINSYNSDKGLEGLKKVLDFWVKKNENNCIRDIINKEIRGENVNQEYFFEVQKLVASIRGFNS